MSINYIFHDMSQETAIAVQERISAYDTRLTDLGKEWWKVREVVLGVTALALLGNGLATVYPNGWVGRRWPLPVIQLSRPLVGIELIIGALLAGRTFICRPLATAALGCAAYPLSGYSRGVGMFTLQPREGGCDVRIGRFHLGAISPHSEQLGPFPLRIDDGELEVRVADRFSLTISPDWVFEPLDSHSTEWQPGEGIQQLSIRSLDNQRINARVVLPLSEPNGQVVLFSFGNGHVFEQMPLATFNALREAGYHIAVYDPPGYGSSAGPRNPRADYFALEAMIQELMLDGFQEEAINLVGQSIGTGAVCKLAAHYRVRRVCLLVPYGSIEGVVHRMAQQIFGGPLGHIAFANLRGIVRERFGYDNVLQLSRAASSESAAQSLAIYQGGQDALMSIGPDQRAAEKLRNIWDQNRGAKPACRLTTDEEAGHLLPFLGPIWTEWLPQQIVAE